jgi:hypothetical protein
MEHHYRVQVHDGVTGRLRTIDVFAASASLINVRVKDEHPQARVLGWYEIQ